MRPERPDIAAPPFPPDLEWLGAEPVTMERACAKGPVLVHFFEASEASSYRSLDWVKAWHERYAASGLTVLGVHTARSDFARQSADLERVLADFGLGFAVANDAERRVWAAYGCRGWPSTFLWRRGGALEWVHFGEGEYQSSERAIRAGLGRDDLPAPVKAERASDAEGARVMPTSPEVFPGGAFDAPLEGSGERLVVDYEAGAAYVALSGSGEVRGSVDGRELEPIAVDGPAMWELADHSHHGTHRLELTPGQGTLVWSIGFGAGVP